MAVGMFIVGEQIPRSYGVPRYVEPRSMGSMSPVSPGRGSVHVGQANSEQLDPCQVSW